VAGCWKVLGIAKPGHSLKLNVFPGEYNNGCPGFLP
jgi:hypothetical protein